MAHSYRINFFALKEFTSKMAFQYGKLQKLGFFRGYSLPYMSMDIRWFTFDDYLRDLKHTYRRQIKKSLKKISTSFPGDGHPGNLSGVKVRFNQWERCPATLFYEYYLRVMERAETKLETLNLPFFEFCFDQLKEDITLITVEEEKEILAAALLFHHAPYLTFALVGNKYQRYDTADPYFNLIYAMIQTAIASKAEQLKLGQTAYWVKQRVGGQPSERYLFFKAKNKILHALLRCFQGSLFPKTQLPEIHVFKKE